MIKRKRSVIITKPTNFNITNNRNINNETINIDFLISQIVSLPKAHSPQDWRSRINSSLGNSKLIENYNISEYNQIVHSILYNGLRLSITNTEKQLSEFCARLLQVYLKYSIKLFDANEIDAILPTLQIIDPATIKLLSNRRLIRENPFTIGSDKLTKVYMDPISLYPTNKIQAIKYEIEINSNEEGNDGIEDGFSTKDAEEEGREIEFEETKEDGSKVNPCITVWKSENEGSSEEINIENIDLLSGTANQEVAEEKKDDNEVPKRCCCSII